MSGRLDVVATPIGNLGDASERMREALGNADLVLVEDTRHSGRLLQQFGLKKPLFALHEHNEADVVPALIGRLQAGETLALISDAGTPTVSDPGFRLIRAARDAGIRVSPIPGASALVAALSVSGLPSDRFVFEGFLPSKAAARDKALTALASESRTMIFFESVHRIEDALRAAVQAFGEQRPGCIARELTKLHEQVMSGPLQVLLDALATGLMPMKGEFVLLIGGAEADAQAAEDAGERLLFALIAEGIGLRDAARVASRLTGASRNALYRAGVSAQQQQ